MAEKAIFAAGILKTTSSCRDRRGSISIDPGFQAASQP